MIAAQRQSVNTEERREQRKIGSKANPTVEEALGIVIESDVLNFQS